MIALLFPIAAYFIYRSSPQLQSAINNVGIKVGNVVNYPQATVEQLAKARAKSLLKISEGNRLDVYKDSRGILTVGIGHKVLPGDNLKLGDKITAARRDTFFENDISIAFAAALSQAKDLGKYNAEFIAALTEVNFQLGTGWATKFYNTYAKLRQGNVQQAISNLKVSDWNKQTPVRVANFIQALQVAYA